MYFKFRNIIEDHQLIRKNDRILLAVSGGLDSVVLTDLVHRIKDEYHLELNIIHLNHGLRGREADRDQEFVEKLAEEYHTRCHVKKVDVLRYVKMNRCSVEEGARYWRYQFYHEILERTGFDALAMGHQSNDQAETILDHFLRGSGVRGLGGMRFRNGRFIRPLLLFTRQEIASYAQSRKLGYVEDSTNAELKYRRNKIRHELIPHLKEAYNPAIQDTLLKMSSIFRDAEDYLTHEAEDACRDCMKVHKKNKIVLDIHQFFKYFTAIKVYVLFSVLHKLGISDQSFHFIKISSFLNYIKKNRTGSKFPLISQWEVLIDHDGLVFHQLMNRDYDYPLFLNRDYEVYDGDKIFKACLIERNQLPRSYPKKSNETYVDYEKIEEPLMLRNFRPGDRFIPFNMKGNKKLSDFFTDEKVPIHLRKHIPIVVSRGGIVGIIGYQIDDRFKITEHSQNILKMELKDVEKNN